MTSGPVSKKVTRFDLRDVVDWDEVGRDWGSDTGIGSASGIGRSALTGICIESLRRCGFCNSGTSGKAPVEGTLDLGAGGSLSLFSAGIGGTGGSAGRRIGRITGDVLGEGVFIGFGNNEYCPTEVERCRAVVSARGVAFVKAGRDGRIGGIEGIVANASRVASSRRSAEGGVGAEALLLLRPLAGDIGELTTTSGIAGISFCGDEDLGATKDFDLRRNDSEALLERDFWLPSVV